MLSAALAAAGLAFAAAAGARAQDVSAGDLVISHAWSPPPLAGRTESAAYFTVRNAGAENDRLIAVSAAIAEAAELHGHVMNGDVMRMEKVEGLTVPAGGELSFEPGGYHVMLFGVREALAPGDSFPMTLSFERAGEIEVSFAVETLAENIAPSTEHSGHQ
jgi:copper(I)-binding protein